VRFAARLWITYILSKITQSFRRLGAPLIVIFIHPALELVHSKVVTLCLESLDDRALYNSIITDLCLFAKWKLQTLQTDANVLVCECNSFLRLSNWVSLLNMFIKIIVYIVMTDLRLNSKLFWGFVRIYNYFYNFS
jgi:hypothetical protein